MSHHYTTDVREPAMRSTTYRGRQPQYRVSVTAKARLTSLIYGNWRALPMTGSCLKKVRITGKKSLCVHEPRSSLTLTGAGVPEEVEKTECLYKHAHKWPLQEYQDNASNKAYCPPDLLFASKEIECLLRSNNKRQAGEKEELKRQD